MIEAEKKKEIERLIRSAALSQHSKEELYF